MRALGLACAGFLMPLAVGIGIYYLLLLPLEVFLPIMTLAGLGAAKVVFKERHA